MKDKGQGKIPPAVSHGFFRAQQFVHVKGNAEALFNNVTATEAATLTANLITGVSRAYAREMMSDGDVLVFFEKLRLQWKGLAEENAKQKKRKGADQEGRGFLSGESEREILSSLRGRLNEERRITLICSINAVLVAAGCRCEEKRAVFGRDVAKLAPAIATQSSFVHHRKASPRRAAGWIHYRPYTQFRLF